MAEFANLKQYQSSTLRQQIIQDNGGMTAGRETAGIKFLRNDERRARGRWVPTWAMIPRGVRNLKGKSLIICIVKRSYSQTRKGCSQRQILLFLD